MDYLDGELLD